MAIRPDTTCILEYEILFPENSDHPTDFSIVPWGVPLSFNEGIATLDRDITCNLPDSLNSQYRVIGVYLDRECNTPLIVGTQISSDSLTNKSIMDGVIVSGTLVAYTKVEAIPKYSITWEYKTSENEDITKVTEVYENSVPIPPSLPLTFIVNENNINYIYSFVSWDPAISEATVGCTYEATYNRTEYKTNVPYLSNNISLFENAVPYYYGSGSPYYNYYLPLGEDDKVEAPENDIKVQMYTEDKYTVGESLGGFKINNYAITYIKKGTFPKLGEKALIWDTGEEGLNKSNTANDSTNCILKGYYNSDKKLFQLDLIDKRSNATNTVGEDLTNIFHAKYPDEFGEREIPTRIGFILVAGGGGGGGVSYFTNSSSTGNGKDSSSSSVTVPGAGGGGAAMTLGVFNFDYPTLTSYSYKDSTGKTCTDGIAAGGYSLWTTAGERLTGDITELKETLEIASVEFHITGGVGGAGNGGGSKRGGNDEDTKDGKEGFDANIHIIINVRDSSNGTLNYYTAELNKLPPQILKVCGGFGGQRGDYSKSEIAAGAGGIVYDNRSSSHLFHLASYSGGSGASVIIQSETGTAGELSEYNKSLYFSSDTPPADYRIDVSHSGVNPGGTANSTTWTTCIFGGHSFGKGGIGEGGAPSKGGGGCSLKVTEGNGPGIEAKDESAIKEPTNGANGYFGIYY